MFLHIFKIMNSNFWKEISNQINLAIKEKKLKGREVAKKAWIAVTYVSEIRRGNRVPSLEKLNDICNAIWIEIHELFTKIYLEQKKENQWENYEEIK